MDINNSPWRFSAGPHKLFSKEYLVEIRALADAAAIPQFERLATQFSDYETYIESRKKLISPSINLMEDSKHTGVIDASTKNPLIQEALTTAHTAACCHLLHSSVLPLSSLKSETLKSMARQFIKSCENKPDEYRMRMVNKFHTMDTIRVIQFLRALGLITRPSEEMYQLGIGAADGSRDILSLHLIPRIHIKNTNDSKLISFHAEQQLAAETIIIDSEPQYKELYSSLNNDRTVNVVAYNKETTHTLKHLPNEISKKRNLVTGLRIDHRMIPDVNDFFHNLAPCISDDCDLILTIGAGDSINDFEGRINKFIEIFSVLENSGLRPLLFKLHGPGSLPKQQKSLYFGNMRASSYEILYCKLNSETLSRTL